MRKYLGTVVPPSDNFFAALNAAVFSDGSFVLHPEGRKCPMELSTYFRINSADTGQFERTLIIADEGAYGQLPRGLHGAEARHEPAARRGGRARRARQRDDQVLDGAELVRGRRGGTWAASTTSSPSAASARAPTPRSRGRRSRPARRSPGSIRACILQGDNSIGEFYSVAVVNNQQQADTGTKMIHIGKNTRSDDRLEGHLGRPRAEQLPRAGEDAAEGGEARATTRSATRC